MSAPQLDDYPELADAVIEAKAQALLYAFSAWRGEADEQRPTPVEVLAEQFLGYEIVITDEGLFADPDYLGGIVFEDQSITVNAALTAHEGRYNFTIAHEIGHHVLHRDHYLRNKTTNTAQIICRDTHEKPLVERQADRFAAALLMPAEWVIAAFETLSTGSQPVDRPTTGMLRGIAARVVETGQFANVSNTAMVNRLIDLGLVSGALYQSGRPQDFYRDARFIGFNQRTLRLAVAILRHPLRFIKKIRRSK